MRIVYGWINIYKSGVYHTPGKPGAFDRHGGDIYPDEIAARSAINPETHYLDTIPIHWTDDDATLRSNPD